jgi:hypothetical protein
MNEGQLIEAVKTGNLSAVAALLASGSDVHQPDESGWAPLHWAAGKGDAAVVALLLQHGANVLQVGHDQRTPYMIALAAARIEAAQLLRDAEDKAGVDHGQRQQQRKYCKAYYVKELRQFAGWTESQIPRQAHAGQGAAEGRAAQGASNGDDDDIVFIHHDLTVTQSMWHNEDVIFDQITPAWEEFCTHVLHFKVPDDLDLVGSRR